MLFHSANPSTCIAATALGAEILEFHVVFDKNMFGPDSSSSIEINQVAEMVQNIKAIEKAKNHPIDKNENSQFKDLKSIFEKSLAVNKDLPENHILKFEDLESKKPKGCGINASNFEEIIGQKLKKPLKKWDFLTEESLH